MKKLALVLLMSTALVAPTVAEAADVTVQVDLTPYSGPAAYLAVYLVDQNGTYDSTLWVAGRHTRYLRSLRGWVRGFTGAGESSVDGISGASVGAGSSLRISSNVSDALIDAGYSIVVDTAVEHWGDYTADAVVPLQTGGGSATGQRFVDRLTVSM